MDLDPVKMAFDLVLACSAAWVFIALRGRDDEAAWLRRLVPAAMVGRAVAGIGLHLLAPGMVMYSDAAVYYAPQARAVLAGLVPYRDFACSYSPLFPYLLAPAAAVWPGPGAAVVTALVCEAGMIALYLRRGRRRPDHVAIWRVALLYLTSPVTVQWVALTGYNTVLVAVAAMAALVLAERGRHLAAASAAILGLWAVKLLTLITWPAVAWCRQEGVWRRTALLAVGGVVLAALPFAGIDSWQPVRAEAGSYTGGNLWFLVVVAVPALYGSSLMDLLPPVTYLAVLLWFLIRHRRALATGTGPFDAGAAMVAAAGLLLMVLSKKSYAMYLVLAWPFALHTLAVRDRLDRWTLLAFTWLGAATTWQVLPQYLGEMLASGHFTTTLAGGVALVGQVLTLASTVLLLARSIPGELTNRPPR